MTSDSTTGSTDQYTFQNPVTRFESITPPAEHTDEPGLESQMDIKADRGETSYRGTGRLTGRKALITGADSGIGAAVAIAFAREGADVALSYLPEEEEDAQVVKGLIEAEGRKAVCIPGDRFMKASAARWIYGAMRSIAVSRTAPTVSAISAGSDC